MIGSGTEQLVMTLDTNKNTILTGALTIGSADAIARFDVASLAYDCGSIAAGVDSTFSITATGAVAGYPVQVGMSVAPEAGLLVDAYCVTNDVAIVRLHNGNLVSAVDPATRTWRVIVTKF